MAIYTPEKITSQATEQDGVIIEGLIPLSAFVSVSNNENYKLTDVWLYSQDERQILNPINIVRDDPNADGVDRTIVPKKDQYAPISAIDDIDFGEFPINGTNYMEWAIEGNAKATVNIALAKQDYLSDNFKKMFKIDGVENRLMEELGYENKPKRKIKNLGDYIKDKKKYDEYILLLRDRARRRIAFYKMLFSTIEKKIRQNIELSPIESYVFRKYVKNEATEENEYNSIGAGNFIRFHSRWRGRLLSIVKMWLRKWRRKESEIEKIQRPIHYNKMFEEENAIDNIDSQDTFKEPDENDESTYKSPFEKEEADIVITQMAKQEDLKRQSETLEPDEDGGILTKEYKDPFKTVIINLFSKGNDYSKVKEKLISNYGEDIVDNDQFDKKIFEVIDELKKEGKEIGETFDPKDFNYPDLSQRKTQKKTDKTIEEKENRVVVEGGFKKTQAKSDEPKKVDEKDEKQAGVKVTEKSAEVKSSQEKAEDTKKTDTTKKSNEKSTKIPDKKQGKGFNILVTLIAITSVLSYVRYKVSK